jgi:hypothetical protein
MDTLQGKGLLTPVQEAFLRLFSGLPDQERFYLTGGTALAEFYLGHRLSFDLDLFTAEADLILPFSYGLESACRAGGLGVQAVRRFSSFVELVVSSEAESVRVDLAMDSPYRFDAPVASRYGVWINGWQDLSVDKLLAYYGRAEPRDAIDLYFILQSEPLDPLLALAAQKDPGFDLYWFAVGLNRAADLPDEAERWPVKMLVEWEPTLIKERFQRLADDTMSRAAGWP